MRTVRITQASHSGGPGNGRGNGGPQWFQITKTCHKISCINVISRVFPSKFHQIDIYFRFPRLSFTLKSCQNSCRHKYALSISRIFYESNFWRVFDIRPNCVGIVGGLWYWCLKVRVDLGVNLCTMMAFDIFFLKEFWPYNGSKRAQSELRSYRKCLNNGGSHLKSTVFFQHQQEWDALLR